MNKLGRRIRKSGVQEAETAAYGDILRWYNDFSGHLEGILRGIDWTAETGAREVIVSARAKRLETAAAKLLRYPDRPLANIVDLAGVRVEGSMTLSQQDAVVSLILWVFGLGEDSVHDLRATPHAGYRAVHIRASFDDYDALAEIQVRTRYQGAWANAYEELGEALGRGIRYGETDVPEDHIKTVEWLQHVSVHSVAKAEAAQDALESAYRRNRQLQGRLLRAGKMRWLHPMFWRLVVASLEVRRTSTKLRDLEKQYTDILPRLARRAGRFT